MARTPAPLTKAVSDEDDLTNEIIKASDKHWYDKQYYASLGKIAGLMRPKKREIKTIALYYWRLHDGGTERVTSRLANIWKALGYRVLLLTDEAPGPLDYHCDPGVERFILPPHRERYVTRGLALARLLREQKVDVFISNLWIETATTWDLFVAKSLGVSVIIGWHNVFDAGIYNGYDIHFFRQRLAAYKHADLVATLSMMDQFWFATQGVPARLIHNPLTFGEMPATTSPLSSKNIVWVGRVEQHQKRIEHVIRMLPLVLQSVPDATLTIVGDGPDRIMAEQLALQLGVANKIRFVGYSSDVEKYLESAAVHIMTSEFEGSPMVISEAWAHGVPTVMYDLAFLEFARGKKGFIAVEQLDYVALAKGVAKVLSDDTLRRKMGDEARATAQYFFDLNIGMEWKAVFDDLATKGDVAGVLSPEDIASVAPILVKHLAGRMYTVDERVYRERPEPPVAPIQAPEPPPKDRKTLAALADKAILLGADLFDRQPAAAPVRLQTIDFGHIGLGDNFMAWVGLHALLHNGYEPLAKDCIMYAPNDMAGLAASIFAKYGLRVEGVVSHSERPLKSPIFSPLPPPQRSDWFKTYAGPDWWMNCFEALDAQKTIPNPHAAQGVERRARLGWSERALYRRPGWQAAVADYIGYRLWLPVARTMGLLPLPYLALVKSALPALRADMARYVDERSFGKKPGPAIALFPAGKSFQAFPADACQRLQQLLPKTDTVFYVQANDPWIAEYRNAGLEPQSLDFVEDLFWVIKSSARLMTTDSFSSHVAQLLRDDFVLALTRDFRENIVHPGAEPTVLSNHPPCAPCNYVPRHDSKHCSAQYESCIAFDNVPFVENIARALLTTVPDLNAAHAAAANSPPATKANQSGAYAP